MNLKKVLIGVGVVLAIVLYFNGPNQAADDVSGIGNVVHNTGESVVTFVRSLFK